MAAQPRNIVVTVVDDAGNSLQGATVTLTGVGNPQVLATGANGQCTFPNLLAGQYRLLISREGFNTRAASVTLTDAADAEERVEMRVVDEATTPARRSRLFEILTFVQYIALAALAIPFVILLYKGLNNGNLNLSDKEAARGMITFVVAVVTVAIGLFLVVGAAFMSGSKDLEKRFSFGKDVFTVLVGVLGTVMGFYYGQTAAGAGGAGANANNQSQTAQTLQISAPRVNPATPKINTDFTLAADISGGEGPFTYTVTFDNANAVTTPAVEVPSQSANISRKFTVANSPDLAGQPIGFTIKATDKNKKTGTSEKGTFTPSP